jgi:TPR repeat protein
MVSHLQYKLSLLRKLTEADSKDVLHIPKQRHSSYCGMILFVAGHIMNGCPTTGRRKDLRTLILQYTTTRTPAALYNRAMSLVAIGQCAAAMVCLNLAAARGHLPSRALMAHMLICYREGVAWDYRTAFELVVEGTRLGCHHCQGVMAFCYWGGWGCVRDETRSLELARESSGKGSRYGQYVLGRLYHDGVGGVAQDYAQALALYQLAAAQNLDGAQFKLGYMYYCGLGVARDYAEALRWYELAAAQGDMHVLYWADFCHELCQGFP